MFFALLGDHADGIELALALAGSGRHQLHLFAGSQQTKSLLQSNGLEVPTVGDLEEVLADPAVDLVIVASTLAVRSAHLRRALQSERHVVCVFPPGDSPDIAYEASMIRGDTGKALLPLLTQFLHPGFSELATLLRSGDCPIGQIRLLQMEVRNTRGIVHETGARTALNLPGWEVVRRLQGEIAEVSAYAVNDSVEAGDCVLMAGKFEKGGPLQATFLPGEGAASWRLTALGTNGQADLLYPDGTRGAAQLHVQCVGGPTSARLWDPQDPWPRFVEILEESIARLAPPPHSHEPAASEATRSQWEALSWQDAVRALELDDSVRRSIKQRRSSTLEYQQATEEAGFKGTMTLVGCGLLWLVIGLVILARWIPSAGWLVIPLLVGFLGMQVLRWALPRKQA